MIGIRTSRWMRAPAHAPRPLFAIGDVHGRADLLAALHQEIANIRAETLLENGVLVHLGDYVDRGPEGMKTLTMALDGAHIEGLHDACLPGNHEQFMRNFLEASGRSRRFILDIWLDNGGTAIVKEIGFTKSALGNADEFADAIIAHLGEDRIKKLFALPNHVRYGRYLFVHAGLHPALGLKMLNKDWGVLPAGWTAEDEDPLWIRGAFLTYEGDFEDNVIVVHGHTPRREPELKANRIGLDTRAYSDGTLTAVQIDGNQVRFIQTRDTNAPAVHDTGLFR